MRKLKLFTHYTILATTPTLLAYPQHNISQVSFQAVNQTIETTSSNLSNSELVGRLVIGSEEKAKEWIQPTTYDEIMVMLEDLESGKFERRYLSEQLERVNKYLATLAKEGILSNEFDREAILEEDIYDLMYGEDSAFKLIIPAAFNSYSGYNIVRCGKNSHAWKKTKNFVRKHKKEIIIGAVVVVAVTIVVVAVVAASSVAAASAATGAAGVAASTAVGSSDSGCSELKKSESKEESLSIIAAPKETLPSVDTNEAPIMKAALDEHVVSFKEFLVEDKTSQQATGFKGWDEMSFAEKAREVGANVAHKALDEVTGLVKVFPQLCEEVKELGDRFLPESLKLPDSGEPVNPIENYENMVAKGHEAIDKMFSTDQTELFTIEARANDPMNNFAIGMIPLPGGIPKVFSNTNNLIKAGNAIDRAGFTKAGRGLMKHGYRERSGFPKPVGNPAQINEQGQRILESILNHPERKCILYDSSRMGKTVDIYAPNIGGARYSLEGEFIGFLEFKK